MFLEINVLLCLRVNHLAYLPFLWP